MDYRVVLKDLSLRDDLRIEIESIFDEIKDLSSGFFVTKLHVTKVSEGYSVRFDLLREDQVLSSETITCPSFSEALEKSKDSLLEAILKEFVLAAS